MLSSSSSPLTRWKSTPNEARDDAQLSSSSSIFNSVKTTTNANPHKMASSLPLPLLLPPMPPIPIPPPRGKATLSSLPPELHLAVAELLTYPDALSLKHVDRYFFSLVNTSIELKIDWLVERRRLHLECPNDRRCDLGSDLRFCRGSVPLLMQRRREHVECESRPGLGCLVYGTRTCAHRPTKKTPVGGRWRARLQTEFTVELWWLLLLALVPALGSWLWMSCMGKL